MTGTTEKEIISGQDILAPLEGEQGEVELSPINKSGMRLAGGVLLLIGAITVLLVGGWFAVTVKEPAQSSAMLDASLKLYDGVVGKTLYPTLTLLIGYIFGVGRGQRSIEK